MLTVNNISITHNNIEIVHNFGVTMFAGCALNVHGSNGSGKSSLLRHLIGLSSISPSQIFYDQTDIYEHMQEYRLMGEYIGHNLGLKESLSVNDNLLFWARIYDTTLLIAPAIHTLRLSEYLEHKVSELSQGTKKRVALARLLITNSTLWFLDEPFANLDNHFRDIMLNMIKARCDQKGIVVLTNHEPMKEGYITNICIDDFKRKECLRI